MESGFGKGINPRLARQPQRTALRMGSTLPVFVSTALCVDQPFFPPFMRWNCPDPSPTWPDPVWASSNTGVATVVAVPNAPDEAIITPVAPGPVIITATVASTQQLFIVDVVPNTPTHLFIGKVPSTCGCVVLDGQCGCGCP